MKPMDMMRLASLQGDKGPIIVTIFTRPGANYLTRVIDYGPAWYRGRNKEGEVEPYLEDRVELETIPLQKFMDFAIGATECIEMLHHKQRIVHGEIRGDAFHMTEENSQVRLITFGSGLRTFEHGLTSSGWSALSKEMGAKNKLSFMSPEQTGRMPAEPDSRTDIYSLGILFWTILTQQPAFEGETPMDIIQGVLGRRLPSVSTVRYDIPDVISRIIQKMTAKIIGDRYHSASGLRHDLIQVQNLLSAGNSEALQNMEIAKKDISSFFILPTAMIGRTDEYNDVVKIIDKVSKRHLVGQRQDVHSLSSGSSYEYSDGRIDNFDGAVIEASSEDAASSNDSPIWRSNSLSANGGLPELKSFKSKSNLARSTANSLHNSFDSAERKSLESVSSHVRSTTSSQHNSLDLAEEPGSSNSNGSNLLKPPWQHNTSLSLESKSYMDSMNSESGTRTSSDSVGSLTNQRNKQKFRRKGRCEVVSISGGKLRPFLNVASPWKIKETDSETFSDRLGEILFGTIYPRYDQPNHLICDRGSDTGAALQVNLERTKNLHTHPIMTRTERPYKTPWVKHHN